MPDPARFKTTCAGPDLRTEVLHNPYLQAAKRQNSNATGRYMKMCQKKVQHINLDLYWDYFNFISENKTLGCIYTAICINTGRFAC